MPMSTFWGATVDRSVSGFITLTLEGVSVTAPVEAGKISKSEAIALFLLMNEYVAIKEVMSGDLWDYRCQYARFAAKVLDYGEKAAALPGNQRAPWTAKQNRMIIERDKFRALAGE